MNLSTDSQRRLIRHGMARDPNHNGLWNGRYCDGDFVRSDLVGLRQIVIGGR